MNICKRCNNEFEASTIIYFIRVALKHERPVAQERLCDKCLKEWIDSLERTALLFKCSADQYDTALYAFEQRKDPS